MKKVEGELELSRSELANMETRSQEHDTEVEASLGHMQQELAKRAQQVSFISPFLSYVHSPVLYLLRPLFCPLLSLSLSVSPPFLSAGSGDGGSAPQPPGGHHSP